MPSSTKHAAVKIMLLPWLQRQLFIRKLPKDVQEEVKKHLTQLNAFSRAELVAFDKKLSDNSEQHQEDDKADVNTVEEYSFSDKHSDTFVLTMNALLKSGELTPVTQEIVLSTLVSKDKSA